jgi:MFS family permease
MASPRILTRTVLLVSFVSLFTDISSEMLYPVMPVYLREVGFSFVLIGILEGLAEAVAGLSKGYFGKLSDHLGKRKPFVSSGYALSAISKPMLALSAWAPWIFSARTIDRIGKGVRTGARDAMLSDEVTPKHKARVFGFHRGMDTLGAAIGPIAAIIFLQYFPGEYRKLFLLAFFPALIGVLLTFLLKEKNHAPGVTSARPSFFSFLGYWKDCDPRYRRLVVGLLFFTLVNSSDVFLLLAIKSRGYSDVNVLWVYVFYNLVYAVAAWPMGMLADKIGLKQTFIGGLILFAFVYMAMPFSATIYFFGLLFLLYGFYAAATEGVAKAWITNIASPGTKATAIGFYTSMGSIMTLLASSLTGLIWQTLGLEAAFIISGAGALAAAIYFLTLKQ